MKPLVRCLDLFCCAGGAAMGLHRSGFDLTGVDINPQPRYPFKFIQGDALAQDLTGYDFVWASPPCQGYSALKTMTNRREHPKLIGEVRDMLAAWGGPWIIENVEGAKNELRNPVMLCGSMFGLGSNGFQLRRHRYFESNFPLTAPGPCRHAPRTLGVFGAKVRDIAQEKRHYSQPKETRGKPVGVLLPQAWGFEAMGCDWMKIDEASEAIPPAYTEHLGKRAMAWITANVPFSGTARIRTGDTAVYKVSKALIEEEARGRCAALALRSAGERSESSKASQSTPAGPRHAVPASTTQKGAPPCNA